MSWVRFKLMNLKYNKIGAGKPADLVSDAGPELPWLA